MNQKYNALSNLSHRPLRHGENCLFENVQEQNIKRFYSQGSLFIFLNFQDQEFLNIETIKSLILLAYIILTFPSTIRSKKRN